jgi:radical SAM protein with 4Fe4S-binding SPASM domain
MNQLLLNNLKNRYKIIDIVDLEKWDQNYQQSQIWLEQQCRRLHRDAFTPHERIVFLHSKDYYSSEGDVGYILKNLQVMLNELDISNSFVVVISTNPNIDLEIDYISKISADPMPLTVIKSTDKFSKILLNRGTVSRKETYQYGSMNPMKININDLTDKEKFLLTESKTFCMYPWIHLHVYPTGQAFPCCHAEMKVGKIGNCRTENLEEIWNGDKLKLLRKDMLNEVSSPMCSRCYEQEDNGFFSGRQSANKHHGHHINRAKETHDDGHLEKFEMTYWDIRFSNLCNLKCRSCGYIFSSQWYQDQAKLAGGNWKDKNPVLNYAGRTETDMWEQLEPHLDYVEQIYFAGGEPLLMEEHYRILEELVQRKMFHVRLIYNTNFTHTELKGNSVFEYWKQFNSVAVGASLDDQGPRAEYIRKGTDWAVVEQNRQEMIRICPEVDFYISPTLSIMNAWHLPDFHRDWVERGLIRAQDLNINILQDPAHYRIDIAPAEYKEQLLTKFTNHINWLKNQDPLQRATMGFESAVKFMMATDNTHLLDTFWRKTYELDNIRKENILTVIPELAALK